jgi:hypothetical protein
MDLEKIPMVIRIWQFSEFIAMSFFLPISLGGKQVKQLSPSTIEDCD